MLTNENFGFKRLTPDNWLETDPVSTLFETLLPEEQKQPITGQEWVRRILEPSLKDTVPLEIRRLFEVARGAMVYGYLFYPLYTLATEQLNRVVETAVSYKCETMRAPKTVNTFEKKINWLIDASMIAENEKIKWDAIRGSRNLSSHPKRQTIIPPSYAVGMLRDTAEKINSLIGDN